MRVPADLREKVGATHINRSLRTASRPAALRQLRRFASDLELAFDQIRSGNNASFGHRPDVSSDMIPATIGTVSGVARTVGYAASATLTLEEVSRRFLDDPSTTRRSKSTLAYRSVHNLVLAIVGSEARISSISREVCRDVLLVLRSLPSNAVKRWPDLSPRQASEKAQVERLAPMSAANVNGYMNKFSALLNWAVREEMISRNPARGLRISDPIPPRDKRKPFDTQQLQQIFGAPLYAGCRDDGHGYAVPGEARPKRARFWVPLIALYSGMRQNEICQLNTEDVRICDGVMCVVVSTSELGDKLLKTPASERVIPLHPILINIGILDYVKDRRSDQNIKLFPEITVDSFGHHSVAFSKWFARYLLSCGASHDLTCFHSFRHCFRDALREAGVDREIALALGGWTSAGRTDPGMVADAYGNGFTPSRLHEAISSVHYAALDLSHLTKD